VPDAQFPPKEDLTICFAHVAYQMNTVFSQRESGVQSFQVWNLPDLRARIGEADVLVISGLWRSDLLDSAGKLRYIQSIGAGYDQFPLDELRRRGIRLANARGVNRNAVSEHAMALLLGLARHIHTGRDNQKQHHWRNMITDFSQREDELGGKTLLIVGLGAIGSRLAKLAKAFDMHVIGTKRSTENVDFPVDELFPAEQLPELLPRADYVALTCPLTPQTEGIIDARALASMKPSAYLVNVARGRVVNEPALLEALRAGQIAGAGLDILYDEPLPADPPFWDLEQVIITPHTAGETRKHESNVVDILTENLERLWRGQSDLRNQII
jgi:phosphoglycerate dehydrogenase-like enzyme